MKKNAKHKQPMNQNGDNLKKKSIKKRAGHIPYKYDDTEVPPLTRKEIFAMRPMEEVLSPELVKAIRNRKVGQRGLQKLPTKISVTVRYSREVIDYFKSTGEGWQTKMDEALKEWIKKHKRVA